MRARRRMQWKGRRHPQCKAWTQEELRDLACPSYKNLLLGHTQRLPSREMVVQIAAYLECSLHERNTLLVAAQYVPDAHDTEPAMFMTVLANATHLVETLPLPAFVLTRDWTLHATNAHFRTLMQLPPIEQLPEAQRTAMHLVFDPHLPVRERITVTPHTWAMHAHTALSRFRNDHVLLQREPWYKARLAEWSGLPDFADYWNRTAETPAPSLPLAMSTPLHDRPIRYHQVQLALGTTPYPSITMLVPADDAARAVLTQLGCTPGQYHLHVL